MVHVPKLSAISTSFFAWTTKSHRLSYSSLSTPRNLSSPSFIYCPFPYQKFPQIESSDQKVSFNPSKHTFSSHHRPLLTSASNFALQSRKMNDEWGSLRPLQIQLINRLISDGVLRSKSVRDAMLSIDRADYCAHYSLAYEDHPVPIGFGQTISAPHMHAWALELLKPNLKANVGTQVLDVGCGSGILCTLFAKMIGKDNGEKVYGIDCVDSLVENARVNISKNDSTLLEDGIINLSKRNGWEGFPGKKFNVIHVGAAAESLPLALVDQLACGGIMMIPIGPTNGAQTLKLIKKNGNDPSKYNIKNILEVRYVPLVKEE